MSKAFTREDDLAEEPLLRVAPSPLPPGVKNYLTPDGAKRLRHELDALIQIERPRLSSQISKSSTEGTDAVVSDARRQLQILDQRIAYLGVSLQSAEIVQPPSAPEEVVRFGATVKVRNKRGIETEYRIVGVDETDIDRDWVSWRSPIARALLNSRIAQHVLFRFPAGEEELEIVAINY